MIQKFKMNDLYLVFSMFHKSRLPHLFENNQNKEPQKYFNQNKEPQKYLDLLEMFRNTFFPNVGLMAIYHGLSNIKQQKHLTQIQNNSHDNTPLAW